MQTEAERFEKLQTKRVGEDSILSHSALCVCGVCLLLLSPLTHTHWRSHQRAWWETEETRMILNSNSRSETEKANIHINSSRVPTETHSNFVCCFPVKRVVIGNSQAGGGGGTTWSFSFRFQLNFSTRLPRSIWRLHERKFRQSVSSHNLFVFFFFFYKRHDTQNMFHRNYYSVCGCIALSKKQTIIFQSFLFSVEGERYNIILGAAVVVELQRQPSQRNRCHGPFIFYFSG